MYIGLGRASMKEICWFKLRVEMNEDSTFSRVVVSCSIPDPPAAAIMSAVEQFVTMFAVQFNDFNKALELICEGARKVQIERFNGSRVQ